MRLVAFVILCVLIAAGWNQSYREHYRSIFGNPARVTRIPVVQVSRQSAPAGQVDRVWQGTTAENPLSAKTHR